MVDWLFRDRSTGRIVLGQLPNVAILVFIVARVLEWLTDAQGRTGAILHWVGTAALLWWAGDELLRGVNPFRRMLGAAVLAVVLYGVAVESLS